MQEAEDCLAIMSLLLEEMIPHAVKYFSGEKSFDAEVEEDSELEDEDSHIDSAGQSPDRLQHAGSVATGDDSKGQSQDCKQQ